MERIMHKPRSLLMATCAFLVIVTLLIMVAAPLGVSAGGGGGFLGTLLTVISIVAFFVGVPIIPIDIPLFGVDIASGVANIFGEAAVAWSSTIGYYSTIDAISLLSFGVGALAGSASPYQQAPQISGGVCYGPVNSCGQAYQGNWSCGNDAPATQSGGDNSSFDYPYKGENLGAVWGKKLIETATAQTAGCTCGAPTYSPSDLECPAQTPPLCRPDYGTACVSSGVNSCGRTGSGFIGCNGLCTALPPPDNICTTCGNGVCGPNENTSTCSEDCGPASASVNGACVRDSVCAENETAATCPSDCASIPIDTSNFKAVPNPVLYNKPTTLSWNVKGATTCGIVGKTASGDVETDKFNAGPLDVAISSKLKEDTNFTLTCSNIRGGRDSKTILVKVLNPIFQEF